MIYGIGTDIVSVPRIKGALERHGDRFARRVLTKKEYKDYLASTQRTHFIAKRFAAKEAAAKAIGLGFRQGLSMTDIGVEHDKNGKPLLVFEGVALELKEKLEIGDSYISIADERDHAVAFVTLMKTPVSYEQDKETSSHA